MAFSLIGLWLNVLDDHGLVFFGFLSKLSWFVSAPSRQAIIVVLNHMKLAAFILAVRHLINLKISQ